MSTLYLCGAGNPAGVRLAINVNKAEQNWDRIAILDDDPDILGSKILDCEILGGFSELAKANKETDQVVNLVAGKTTARWKVRNILKEYGLPFATLIHPGVDTLGVTFGGVDITVYDNATLGACSHMEDGCIVFMNAVLGHRASMAPCSILGPGAVLNARVQLGERAYFGTNASILPDLKVGVESTVGANSSVVSNVPDGATAIGIPAEILTAMGESDVLIDEINKASLDPDLIKTIDKIWREILKVDKLRPNDNFFDVGGTSLKAMQIFEALKQITQSTLAPVDIFRFPTIESLASHLGSPSSTSSSKKNSGARARARRRRMRRKTSSPTIRHA